MKLAPFFICKYRNRRLGLIFDFEGLAEVAKGAKYSKCPSIDIDENEKKKGPECDTDYCQRRCKNGFIPAEPSKVALLNVFKCELPNNQVFCFKKGNGTFKWIDEVGANAVLGPCMPEVDDIPTTLAPTTLPPRCKAIELKGSQVKSGIEVNCKYNSSKFVYMCCKHILS